MSTVPVPSKPDRLSIPIHLIRPPRELSPREEAALLAIADQLIPHHNDDLSPSEVDGYRDWLRLAVAARSDWFAEMMAILNSLDYADSADLEKFLRSLRVNDPYSFTSLSSIIAGAYLMAPGVREAIDYPGLRRDPAGFEDAVDDLADGILDAVTERGPIFVSTVDL